MVLVRHPTLVQVWICSTFSHQPDNCHEPSAMPTHTCAQLLSKDICRRGCQSTSNKIWMSWLSKASIDEYQVQKRQADSIMPWNEWARHLNEIVMVQSLKVQLGSRRGGGQGAAALASVELGCPSRNVLSLSSALYLHGKAPCHQLHPAALIYLNSICSD